MSSVEFNRIPNLWPINPVVSKACWVFVAGFVFFMAGPSAAFADESMSFGAGEVGIDAEDKKLESRLKKGKKLFQNDKHERAAVELYKILDSDKAAAETYAPKANYWLGRALLELDLPESALTYFGRVVEAGKQHPHYGRITRHLFELLDKMPENDALLERIAAFAKHLPEAFPSDKRDYFSFLLGRHFFREASPKKAIELLETIEADSHYFGKARYLLAVTYVSDYQAKPAIRSFKQLLRYLFEKRETTGLDSDQKKLVELAHLGMARVFYSAGDYETSIKYFEKIPRQSSRWATALFEKSWAHFQLDQYGRALGNLHALKSPFLPRAFFPEALVLRAVIYFHNCQYDKVRNVLERVEPRYNPVRKAAQSLLDRYDKASKMLEWVRRVRGDKAASIPDPIEHQVKGALDDKQVTRALERVEQVRAESDRLGNMSKRFRSSALGATLQQETALAESFAVDKVNKLARQRLKKLVHEVEDLEKEKREIKFEVARAERGEIKSDIRAGMQVAKQKQTRQVEASDEQMVWDFGGAYWRDEVGYYRIEVTSQCKR